MGARELQKVGFGQGPATCPGPPTCGLGDEGVTSFPLEVGVSMLVWSSRGGCQVQRPGAAVSPGTPPVRPCRAQSRQPELPSLSPVKQGLWAGPWE